MTPRLLHGLPKEAIVDDAEQWGADLIVVGSNGYGTLKQFLLGSVSLVVSLNAPCSVDIVRQPDQVQFFSCTFLDMFRKIVPSIRSARALASMPMGIRMMLTSKIPVAMFA